MFDRASALVILSGMALLHADNCFALSADEMIRLKQAGVSEPVIILMIQGDYKDAGNILKLKEAGFTDETIETFIKSELKENAARPPSDARGMAGDLAEEEVVGESPARIKIMWYMVYRGEPVLQNSKVINDAKLSVDADNSIKFEWKDETGLGMLDLVKQKWLKSPLYWNIVPGDVLLPGQDGYKNILRSERGHRGQPDTDESHYWMIYLDPENPRVIDQMREMLDKR